MQDAGKFPPQKPNQNGEAAPDTPRGKQEREAADKPALKVTFERPETRDALKSSEKYAAQVALVPEPAPANSYRSDAAAVSTKEAKSQDVKAGRTMPLLTKPESSDVVARSTPAAAREVPSTAQLLTVRFTRVMLLAAVIGITSAVAGLYLSYWLDVASGATIVLVQTGAFLLALLLGPRGWLGRRAPATREVAA